VVLDTDTVAFTLKGPASELGRLSEQGVFAYVNVEGLKRGEHEVSAAFVFPETISLKGDPPTVRLRVEKAS
jgi:hypothetical protein